VRGSDHERSDCIEKDRCSCWRAHHHQPQCRQPKRARSSAASCSGVVKANRSLSSENGRAQQLPVKLFALGLIHPPRGGHPPLSGEAEATRQSSNIAPSTGNGGPQVRSCSSGRSRSTGSLTTPCTRLDNRDASVSGGRLIERDPERPSPTPPACSCSILMNPACHRVGPEAEPHRSVVFERIANCVGELHDRPESAERSGTSQATATAPPLRGSPSPMDP